ncbi:MAG: hypothetical protein RIC57_06050 [Balneola sp.]
MAETKHIKGKLKMELSLEKKILWTLIWILLGISFMFGYTYEPTTIGNTPIVDLPMSIYEANKLGSEYILKPGRYWHENVGAFALLMIPLSAIWIWSAFQDNIKNKPVKRRSRMF